ncbi:O-methyltransferase [Daejeonella sp.]|uniref:O-methyltransferase n=1 Tax=Daejeonella sp. TaxID=2805397 RepID=UPI002728A85D|nr:O-methyltransferase [Daejeonella sp.]MDO8991994.1 O-methyltransferase [Daejeonella sp.]MDP2414082.1 O-methyltransferase [Daejeonella sp.]
MDLLSDELKSYLKSSCDPESDLLKQIDRETHLKVSLPRMLSGHYQGRILSMLSKLICPRRILEVGTFTGYATLCLAEGLNEDGILHTIDINAELEDMVRTSFDKSDLGPKIKYHIGNALEIIPNLNEIFDLIFIDADKKNNESYYNLTIDKLRSGGLIIVDNVLWSGKVIGEKKTDSATTLISNFNEMVSSDQRVEKLILPVRDGIYIIRKK